MEAPVAGEGQPRGRGHVRAVREHRRLGHVDLAAHVPHLQHCLLAHLPGTNLTRVFEGHILPDELNCISQNEHEHRWIDKVTLKTSYPCMWTSSTSMPSLPSRIISPTGPLRRNGACFHSGRLIHGSTYQFVVLFTGTADGCQGQVARILLPHCPVRYDMKETKERDKPDTEESCDVNSFGWDWQLFRDAIHELFIAESSQRKQPPPQ